MKPLHSWQFSAPIAEVDIPRIIREARRQVVRFTVDGKVYTAWPARLNYNPELAPNVAGTLQACEKYVGHLTYVERHTDGTPRIWFHEEGSIRVEPGDHVKAIVDGVKVKVEVFAVPQ
jgi:hypothetical protein